MEWMTKSGTLLAEGNLNKDQSEDREKPASFGWRGGQERQTTGIWMWSEPFIRKVPSHPEEVAVLLMDTQGMFDNETSMQLTACIFGLSTLISSYQIYNVDKRIQEDNLQHLALFSEYGRMGLDPKARPVKEKLDKLSSGAAAALNKKEAKTEDADAEGEEGSSNADEKKSAEEDSEDLGEFINPNINKKPFQRLDFLVRDWQNFDEEEDDYEKLRNEMTKYLTSVISTRDQEDLATTREQILRCYTKLSAFLLPHPGFSVTKKSYDGDITKIEPQFRQLLDKYVRRVFDDLLEPKEVNGRNITAPELGNFVQAYVNMFKEGAHFPRTMTMLEATAEANNKSALQLALSLYQNQLDPLAGPSATTFVKPEELEAVHNKALQESLNKFDEVANMGPVVLIARTRNELESKLAEEWSRYQTANVNRNPFKDAEIYMIAVVVGVASFIIAKVFDATCSDFSQFCNNTANLAEFIYMTLIVVALVMYWNKLKMLYQYVKEIAPVMLGAQAEKLKSS